MFALNDSIPLDEALDQASAFERSGEFDRALAIYTSLQRRHPDNYDLKYRAGKTMLRLGQFDAAIPLLRQVLFAEPAHTAARSHLGNCLLMLGQLEAAQEAFAAVLDSTPDNRNALYGMATILLRQERHAEARPLAERLLALLPDDAAALTLVADTWSRDPQLDRAIAEYRNALRIDPSYAPALKGLAGALLHRLRHEEALHYADSALALNHKDPEAHCLRGEILLANDDHYGARESFEAALTLKPDDPAILTSLSIVARRANNLHDALRDADRAWRFDPESRAAANALGATLAAMGHQREARMVLMAGGRRDQVDEAVWALVERKLNDPEGETVPALPLRAESDEDLTPNEGDEADRHPDGNFSLLNNFGR